MPRHRGKGGKAVLDFLICGQWKLAGACEASITH